MRLEKIYKEHPKQERNKPYQIKQDELLALLKPRLFWDSSSRGTFTRSSF
jgi:hypothetical protein